jgi:hypothetical protein
MNQTQDVAAARWGIAYHSNSSSPRARKWYRVSRLVFADGGCTGMPSLACVAITLKPCSARRAITA